jgi:hypothetical protein
MLCSPIYLSIGYFCLRSLIEIAANYMVNFKLPKLPKDDTQILDEFRPLRHSRKSGNPEPKVNTVPLGRRCRGGEDKLWCKYKPF